MEILEILSSNMKRYRARCGFTQEQLAQRCGLHRTYIGGIEQKRINVSVRNLSSIARALGVEAYELIKPLP